MYIYKITNKLNGKVYIGQTINTVDQRWKRHVYDSKTKDTHFARAIRKYGAENFIVETIDTAESTKELNEKEIYWIKYYNSNKEGYNSTDGGDDTYTYKYRTEEEMEQTKEKIRQTKLGGKNPMAVKVKCRNEQTGEEYHFDSLSEMQTFLKGDNHNFITRRCRHQIDYLYEGIWNIAYEEDEYRKLNSYKKNGRQKRVLIKNLETNEEIEFPSFAAAERHYNKNPKYFSGKAYQKGKSFKKSNFEITVLD